MRRETAFETEPRKAKHNGIRKRIALMPTRGSHASQNDRFLQPSSHTTGTGKMSTIKGSQGKNPIIPLVMATKEDDCPTATLRHQELCYNSSQRRLLTNENAKADEAIVAVKASQSN